MIPAFRVNENVTRYRHGKGYSAVNLWLGSPVSIQSVYERRPVGRVVLFGAATVVLLICVWSFFD